MKATKVKRTLSSGSVQMNEPEESVLGEVKQPKSGEKIPKSSKDLDSVTSPRISLNDEDDITTSQPDTKDEEKVNVERTLPSTAFEKRLSVGQLGSLARQEEVSTQTSNPETTDPTDPSSLMLSVHNTSQCHPVSLSIINPDAPEKNQSTSPHMMPKQSVRMRTTPVMSAKKRVVTLYPAWQQTARLRRLEQQQRLEESAALTLESKNLDDDADDTGTLGGDNSYVFTAETYKYSVLQEASVFVDALDIESHAPSAIFQLSNYLFTVHRESINIDALRDNLHQCVPPVL